MLKKTFIIAALITLGATTLFANVQMEGTFWGDASGTWKGTIIDTQDPILFKGFWTDGHQEGTLYAEGYIDGGYYVFELGDGYDSHGTLIGHWSGKISIYNDDYSTGPWWGVDLTISGKWGGYKI